MRLAAAAVTGWIVIQALINIGAVLGLLPITGIPLPLVSEGLSSLLVTMAGARHADVLRPARARRRAGTCGGWTRRAPAHPKLAGPGRAAQLAALAAGVPGGTAIWVGDSDVDERGHRGRRHRRPYLSGAGAGRRAPAGRPGMRSPAWAPSAGWRPSSSPTQGYDLALIPPVPLPRKLTPQLASVPERMLAAVSAAAEVLDEVRGRRAGRLRRLRGHARLPGRVAPQGADRGARGQLQAGPGQPDRRPAHRPGVHRPARRQAAARPVHRHPDPAADRQPGPARARRPGPRALRPAPRPAGAAGHRRLAGRPVGQPRGPGRGPGRCARPGIQVLHIIGPRKADVRVPPGEVPYIVLPYLDRMDLGYAAADFALCRPGR